ncbi:hypothetical protein FOL47_004247 [Perkinsus chesapeaki]|uniref:Tubulin--tyrosine ligase-like protein 5 n=1 Tax=Perkinsus chesapeaki TaxID=330153 RepID=A0A7J6M3Q3_PERCH|nr:hypothetical protein FOL47_004247 [Perkinsus chesapeaki]
MWWKGEYPGCPADGRLKNIDLEEEVQSIERYLEDSVHAMGFTSFNAVNDIKIPRCIKFKPIPGELRSRKSRGSKVAADKNRRPSRSPPIDTQASTSASSAGSAAFPCSAAAAYLPYSAGLGKPGFRLSHSDAPLIRETMSELTRKDRLWSHYAAMQELFGAEEFDYLPETFVLPADMDSFLEVYDVNPSWIWIVKPASQSRGRGIFLLRDLEDLPVDSHCVISRYIANPYLIQGYKFDLRVYVLVTGFDPLRIYMYREGLTRLACSPFAVKTTDDLQNKYKHLTNYSICKNSNDYVENSDARVDNFGHKWSLSAFNKHCSYSNLDMPKIWARIIDAILKTIMASERLGHVGRSGISSRAAHCCFELFGFDILLDSRLKPWVIEVNLSPSLVADTPLDRKIKAHLISDVLNLVGVPVSSPLGDSYQRYYGSSFASMLSRLPKTLPPSGEDRPSTSNGWANGNGLPRRREAHGHGIDERSFRALVQVLGEVRRHHEHLKGKRGSKNNFIRIYPTPESARRFRGLVSAQSRFTRLINDVLYGLLAGPVWPVRDEHSTPPRRSSSQLRISADIRESGPARTESPSNDIRVGLLILEYCERLCILLESLSPSAQANIARTASLWTRCQALASEIPSQRPWHPAVSAPDFVDRMRARLSSLASEGIWASYSQDEAPPSTRAKCRRYVPASVAKSPTGSKLLRGLAVRSTMDLERELTTLGFSAAFSAVMVIAADPKSFSRVNTSLGRLSTSRIGEVRKPSDILPDIRRTKSIGTLVAKSDKSSSAMAKTVAAPSVKAQLGHFFEGFTEEVDFEV